MLNACTANNKCPVVTGCDHMRLASTVEYTPSVLYESCTPEKKDQICMLKKLQY